MPTKLTVGQFFDAARESCELEVEAGEKYLNRPVTELAINRPGLALAGFFSYFAHKRIQVFGLAENSYLRSKSREEREACLRTMMKQKIPCVVLTRNRHATREIRVMAQQAKVPLLRSKMITSHFINKATIMLEELSAPNQRVHGTMMDIAGIGVLLEGNAGVGKSETALGLVERGHSLVADDLTILTRTSSGTIVGRADDVTRYHMEIRGLGIVNIPALFGMASIRQEKNLDLILKLYRSKDAEREADRTGLNPDFRKVLNVSIPLIQLPVVIGRDMANVIEVAAMNQKLKLLGHDAAKEFNEKLIASMANRDNSR